MAQVGLALATSIGAWINLGLVLWLAGRRGLIGLDPDLRRAMLKIAAAGIALGARFGSAKSLAAHWVHEGMALRDEALLALLVAIGAAGLWRSHTGAIRAAMACGFSPARRTAPLTGGVKRLPLCDRRALNPRRQ